MQLNLFESRPLPLRVKNGVEHRTLPCKSILNYVDTPRMPDCFTINPYRGCEFGCTYCYARYTHQFMELGSDEFERLIFVKGNAGKVLLRSLDVGRLAGRHIAIGTATDPYQPAEARFRITRQLLEALDQVSGLRISITTKSSLIKRDAALLRRLADKHRIQINMSLISVDESLLRRLEPKSSRPGARLNTLQALRSQGLTAGIFVLPILPGLTDGRRSLEAVMRAARDHDASFLAAGVLFLSGPSRDFYLSWLKREHPRLARSYLRLYAGRNCRADYKAKTMSLVDDLRQRYGLGSHPRPAPNPRLAQGVPAGDGSSRTALLN